MQQSNSAPSTFWHTMTGEAAASELQSSFTGLTQEEALARLDRYGPNELQAGHRISPWVLFMDQFKNVLIIILLVATALSAFLGHGVESIAIAVIVLFAVLLGFVQEYRSERAIEALRQMAAPTAAVVRDGNETKIAARDIVPGDVILIRPGDKIPADARLIESVNLQIEEAALTGESVAVEKQSTALDKPDLALGDRTNMAYAGTTASYGRGRALVVATGMCTEFGKIARMLQTVQTGRTPLQKNLDRVGNILARTAFLLVGLIVVLGLLRGQPFLEMLIFGIALAVAVVPEALPAVVTISLAIGVQRMVKRHALMRRLPAVETLGSTSVICSDKTGTLTKDEMTIRKIYVAGDLVEVSGSGYSPKGTFTSGSRDVAASFPLQQLLIAGSLASDTRLVQDEQSGRWHIKGDPTEGALVVAACKAGLEKAALELQYPRVSEIPFTSETKRMTTLHAGPEATVAYAKGAPEIILEACERHLTNDGEAELDAADREAIRKAARLMAGEALRVLAVASKQGVALENAEQGMTFLGLVGMIDPPRPEVKDAIQTCKEAGIKPVMITGDHPLTARAVADELGLIETGRVMTGADLEAMSAADLEREVDAIEIYARVSPVHKLRVVEAFQARGHVVAMTGDGVNDAPALKKADIGVAMGITGTDVTKEAAAMTLTDDNFASIVAAVEEGRGIFDNIKKYLMYLLSSNIGEIGLMAVTMLLGMPLPLSAVQILYVNLATDGLPALALAVDPRESDLMQRRPRNPRTGVFTRPVVALMLVGGIWSTLVNVSLFAWAMQSGCSIAEAMTMTFVSLVLIQFFKAFNFRSDRHSVLKKPFANRWLNMAILWELMLLGLVVYVPWLHEPFGTFSLPMVDLAIIIVVSFSVVPILELAKWMVRNGWFGDLN
ncbi:MAG: cation-translocating P-type ATPase [Syntrophobacteraceae bacterium]